MKRGWLAAIFYGMALVLVFVLGFALGLERAAAPETPAVQTEETLTAASSAPEKGGKLNLNTADADALATLPGIGPELAARIVAYREVNGPFAAVEEIMDVRGIGEKRFEAIRQMVTVEEQDEDTGSGR